MILDAHAHILPDTVAERGTANIAAFYDLPIRHIARVDTLLAVSAEAGIGRTMICSVATAARQVERVNQFIAEQIAACPNRLIGFATMHPDYEDVQGEVDRALARGLRGFKIHPDMQKTAVDDERLYPFYEAIAGRLPLLTHAGDDRFNYSNPAQIKRVLDNFPRLTVIGAHFCGWSVWQEARETLAGRPNLLVDTSSSLYAMSPEQGAALVRTWGAERVMFGTDFPMWTPKEELELFLRLDLTDAEREQVLSKTARTVMLGE